MKKTIAYLGALFFSLVLLSCSKHSTDNFSPIINPDKVITATIVPGQTYVVDVALRGSLSITKQSIHHSLSETGVNEKNGYRTYKYVPASGFAGTDEVVLLHRTEATGDNYSGCIYGGSNMNNNNNTSIAVKITIAN